MARKEAARSAVDSLRLVQEKRARAEARRVRHFEQLGEAKRAAAVARAEAKVESRQTSRATTKRKRVISGRE